MRITAVPSNYWCSRRERAALASAATLTAMAAVLASGSAPAQAAVSHRTDVITPDAISSSSTLEGVSADSPTDAWAVGSYENSSGVHVPLLLHWNGTTWTKVKSPTPSGSTDAYLEEVSADSSTDAWAAGYYESSGTEEPLLLHWNGTKWKLDTIPVPAGAQDIGLEGVSVVSPTDAWAVGSYESSGAEEPLLLRWNGTSWSQVASPVPSGAEDTALGEVSVVSSTDAWAAGWYYSSGVYEPLLLQWNGTAWSQVANPAPNGATLEHVSADSATDAWAAGSYDGEPLLLQWNGTAWSQVANPAPSGTHIEGVSAVSSTDAWAAGYYSSGLASYDPVILHWTGKAWKQVKSPVPSGAEKAFLYGVSADSPTDAWAAGSYENSSGVTETLILHWTGKAWKKVKSPNGT